MSEKFNLSKDQKDEMIGMIELYFEKQGEEIGNLEAMMLLDFFVDKLATKFYNIGVEDCYEYMTTKLDDIFEIQK